MLTTVKPVYFGFQSNVAQKIEQIRQDNGRDTEYDAYKAFLESQFRLIQMNLALQKYSPFNFLKSQKSKTEKQEAKAAESREHTARELLAQLHQFVLGTINDTTLPKKLDVLTDVIAANAGFYPATTKQEAELLSALSTKLNEFRYGPYDKATLPGWLHHDTFQSAPSGIYL